MLNVGVFLFNRQSFGPRHVPMFNLGLLSSTPPQKKIIVNYCITGIGRTQWGDHDVYSTLALALPKPERSNRSSGFIRNSYLLNKQMIIDNS
jgi:hypothetical protein